MHRLYKAATIWSAGAAPTSALLVNDGFITAVGSDALASSYDEIVDLGDVFVMPAFIDGHAHPLFAGREMLGPQVNNLQSVEEILAAVATYALENPDQAWIIGGAYEAAIIGQGDFDAHWLDSVVSDRPVVLHAVDHHTVWVNSMALKIAGVNADTKDPDGGSIARRDNGEPKGTLREPAAIDLVTQYAPPLTLEQEVHALTLATNAMAEVGIGTAVDAWIEKGMAEVYVAAAQAKKLAVNMNLCFLAQPHEWKNEVRYFQDLRTQINESISPWWEKVGSPTNPKVSLIEDENLIEVDYGQWSGKKLSQLSRKSGWKTVQSTPSAMYFPSGEGLAAVQERAMRSVHQVLTKKGRGSDVFVSHGDVIKSIVASALSMHLDDFQRIVIDPASVTVLDFSSDKPRVLLLNDSRSDLESFLNAPFRARNLTGGGA